MEWRYLLDVSKISDKRVDEYDGKMKYSATGDVDFNRIINFEEVDYDSKPSRANRKVLNGEVIFAKMKGTTKVLKIIHEIADEYIFSTGFTTLKNKKDLSKDYLYYILISDYFQKEKDKYCSGATQKAINNTNLKKIKIPVPSMENQKQIVQLLDQAQALIDKRKEQIEALDQLIESIFYDMFGDPVRNEKGWEVKKLGDCMKFIRYGVSNPPKFSDTGNKFIRATNIKNGQIISENMRLIAKKENDRLSNYQLILGDFIVVRSGVNSGDAAYVNNEYVGSYLGYDLLVRLDLSKLNYIYLNQIFLSNYRSLIIDPLTRRAAQPHINADQVKNLEIPIPSIYLQGDFAAKVEVIEKQKELLNQSLELMEENYKSIMAKAFKGQLFKRR